jgi:acyl-CoA thioesterase I
MAFPALSATENRPVIVCFGDSLTAGHGTESGHAYPDYLQQLLDHRGYSYRILNRGIDGNTTKDGVERLKDVLSLHPQIVIVEFGGNDGLRGVPITATRQNLDQIVSTLVKSGTKILLAGITLPPNYGQDYIQQFNETYTTLAHKYRLPFIPFLLKDVYGTPGSMQDDGIHATAQGNQQVARNVFQALQPLLKK